MPKVLLSYDLFSGASSNDEFLRNLTKSGWSDHIMRDGRIERLPNTILVTEASASSAKTQFDTARNIASLMDSKFRVTHWTMTIFDEITGGVDIEKTTKSAEILKDI